MRGLLLGVLTALILVAPATAHDHGEFSVGTIGPRLGLPADRVLSVTGAPEEQPHRLEINLRQRDARPGRGARRGARRQARDRPSRRPGAHRRARPALPDPVLDRARRWRANAGGQRERHDLLRRAGRAVVRAAALDRRRRDVPGRRAHHLRRAERRHAGPVHLPRQDHRPALQRRLRPALQPGRAHRRPRQDVSVRHGLQPHRSPEPVHGPAEVEPHGRLPEHRLLLLDRRRAAVRLRHVHRLLEVARRRHHLRAHGRAALHRRPDAGGRLAGRAGPLRRRGRPRRGRARRHGLPAARMVRTAVRGDLRRRG